MADFKLYIGNKNYSSWSLRAWLTLRRLGVEFEEEVITLDQSRTRESILRYSPSGRVPVLHHGDLVIWDSLAINEYLAEEFPKAGLWPSDPKARALARSVSAEMHAGFADLRAQLPMNIRSSFPGRSDAPSVQGDVNRVNAIWRDCLDRFGGGEGFLFGHFTIADAMFAPVVSRFLTYKVSLDETAAAYADAIWSMPEMKEWVAAAKKEPMIIERAEF
jgi:glutathione S-transferase